MIVQSVACSGRPDPNELMSEIERCPASSGSSRRSPAPRVSLVPVTAIAADSPPAAPVLLVRFAANRSVQSGQRSAGSFAARFTGSRQSNAVCRTRATRLVEPLDIAMSDCLHTRAGGIWSRPRSRRGLPLIPDRTPASDSNGRRRRRVRPRYLAKLPNDCQVVAEFAIFTWNLQQNRP